jgi:hypothetical protein
MTLSSESLVGRGHWLAAANNHVRDVDANQLLLEPRHSNGKLIPIEDLVANDITGLGLNSDTIFACTMFE